MHKVGSGLSLTRDEWKAALIWFLGGCIFSILLFLLNMSNSEQNSALYLISNSLKFILPFLIMVIGVIQYRKKLLYRHLAECSEETISKRSSFLVKRRPFFSTVGNSEVEINYEFLDKNGNRHSRSDKYLLLRRIKKLNYFEELQSGNLTILYDPDKPELNVWEFEMSNYNIHKGDKI